MKRRYILIGLIVLIVAVFLAAIFYNGIEEPTVEGVWRTSLSVLGDTIVPDENGWLEYELKDGQGRQLMYRNGQLVDAQELTYVIQNDLISVNIVISEDETLGTVFTWERKRNSLTLSSNRATIALERIEREYPDFVGLDDYVQVMTIFESSLMNPDDQPKTIIFSESDAARLLELLRNCTAIEKPYAELRSDDYLYYVHLYSGGEPVMLTITDELVSTDDGARVELSNLSEINGFLDTLPRIYPDPSSPAAVLANLNVDDEGLCLVLSQGTDPNCMEYNWEAQTNLGCAANAEHFLDYNLKLITWEKADQEFVPYEEPRVAMQFYGDGDWGILAFEGEEYVRYVGPDVSGWYLPRKDGQVLDVYRLLRQWYDEVEFDVLEQYVKVADRGQSPLKAAKEYMVLACGLHLEATKGSKYCCSYIEPEVTIDEIEEQETQRLRESGQIGENEYCFSVKIVFVPENEEALMWGMAGNTVAYDGNDPRVPKDALQQWNCGIIGKENGKWKLTHFGTAW